MGKNSDRESLIRLMANTIVHKIVAEHTNRPESKNFLESEIIEYGGQTRRMALEHHWTDSDKSYIKEKTLKKTKEKISLKYPDVPFSEKEAKYLLDKEVRDLE